jgi:hypothetical protein
MPIPSASSLLEFFEKVHEVAPLPASNSFRGRHSITRDERGHLVFNIWYSRLADGTIAQRQFVCEQCEDLMVVVEEIKLWSKAVAAHPRNLKEQQYD